MDDTSLAQQWDIPSHTHKRRALFFLRLVCFLLVKIIGLYGLKHD